MGPTVQDGVREGYQTMSNMEDNDASAMAAPGTHQPSAGLETMALHQETVQTPYCVCLSVWDLKISNWMEKNTQKNDSFRWKKGALLF